MRKMSIFLLFLVGCVNLTLDVTIPVRPDDTGMADGGAADGGPADGAGMTSLSCSSCSVPCSVIASGLNPRFIRFDGTSFYALDAREDGVSALRISTDGAMETLAKRLGGHFSFAASPTALVWTETGPTDTTFSLYTLLKAAGSTPELRGTVSGSNPGAVADGDTLYFVPEGTSSLTAAPLLGGASRAVAMVPDDAAVFDVDDDAVYYAGRSGAWRQPKGGAAPTRLAGPGSYAGDRSNFYVQRLGQLLAVPRDGGAARVLVQWSSNGYYAGPGMTATAAGLVRYIDPVCRDVNMGCAIRSVPAAGGAVTTLCSSIETPLYVMAGDRDVYVVDGDKLLRLTPP
jgi:hypothetical protein